MFKLFHPIIKTNTLMRQVLYALSLGIIISFYFFGWGIIWQILLASIGTLGSEALVLKLRNRPIKDNLNDGSALITGVLLGLALPSIAPWWLGVLGGSFAIIFGKQLYGGLGNNPFNPAMLGYVFLLISYPLEMTAWQNPVFLSFEQSIQILFFNSPIDALSSATALDRTYDLPLNLFQQASMWINLGFLLGGVYLLLRRVIFWHIPVAVLLGVFIMASLLNLSDASQYHSGLSHLLLGAAMLGAFFIATDPVSAATTPKGRLIYGFGVGILIIIMRELSGNYPDGVAFAVLLMNILTPLIDVATQPKVLGNE